MADDGKLRLGVEVGNLENSAKGFNTLADNMSKAVEQAKLLGVSAKELSALNSEMKSLASTTKAYASVMKDANTINKGLAQVETEKARALTLSASAAASNAKALDLTASAASKDAQAVKNLTSAEVNRESVNLKILQQENQRLAIEKKKQDAIERTTRAEEKAARSALKSGAYSNLTKDLSAYTTKLKDALAAGNVNGSALDNMVNKYKRLQGEVTNVNSKFIALTGTTDGANGMMQMLSRSVASFIGNSLAMWLQQAVRSMIDFGKEVSNSGVALDALRNTMMAATGGWNSGGKEIKWLLGMSNDLGVAFGDVSDSYAKFMTSFTRSGGTIAGSRQIFQDISTAMVSLHLPAEKMQGVFVALEQMANKGTVQAEELKRQLGNALPGAFELAAESMGILPAKLMDLMKKGQVVSKDFLPAFAKTVKDVLGQSVGIAVDQFNANINRLSTATSLLKMELGQGLNSALLPLVKLLTSGMSGLANMATFFNENTVAAAALKAILIPLGLSFAVLTGAIIANTAAFISAQVASSAFFIAMSAGAKKLVADALALNISLGGLPIIAGTLITALAGLGFYIADTSKKASDIEPYIGMRGQIVELVKSVTSLNLSTKEGQSALVDYKNEFPQLTEYLVSTGKQFKDLTEKELKNIVALGVHDAKMRVMVERTAELSSWQGTLAAAFGVAWDYIKGVVSKAGENIIISMNWIKSSIKPFVEWLENRFSGIGEKIVKQASLLTKKYDLKGLKDLEAVWSDLSKTVSDKKLENANNNAIKKLKEINKGAVGTVKALKQAQAAVKGLTGGDDGKKKKKGATETEWDKFNKEISALEELIKIRKLNGQSIDDLVPKYVRLKAKQEEINNSVQRLTEKGKSAWDLFGKEISQVEDQIRVRKLNGQSIDDLVPKYVRLKMQQDDINKSIQNLTTPVSELADKWKQLEKNLTEAENKYKMMLSSSEAFTSEEIKKQESLMMGLKVQVQYNKKIEDSTDLMNISSRAANQLSSTLVDDLFTALDEGETVWSRFRDAGLSAFKALATDWVKKKTELMGGGFQAGWAVQSLYDKSTGNTGSLSSSLSSGITGAIQGLKGEALGGTKNDPSGLSDMIGKLQSSTIDTTTSAVKNFTAANAELSAITSGTLAPALSDTVSSIGAVSAPATSAASSIVQMSASAPIASAATASMSSSMTALAPIVSSAVPALTSMGTVLAEIATSASTAAVSMAALAVATAAQTTAQIPFVGGFLAPAAALATGAAISAGVLMTGASIGIGSAMAGIGQGIGNLTSSAGSTVIKHAKGGVVSSPTTFPMQGGNIGLAGEAGTEVIAPARRMSNGEVGVGAVSPTVTINNYANAAVEVIKRPDNETEIKVTELNAMLSSSRTNKGMSNAQNRLSTSGRRIG